MDRLTSASVLTALALAIGCGTELEQKADPTTAQTAPSSASTPQQAIVQTVTRFLEAVRKGDTNQASAQLTPLALERIRENNMTISPPASETAKFQLGDVEIIDGNKAIVASVWTDLDVDGQWYDQNTTWALRLGNGQWRISGMAEDLGAEQEPLVIDFENPTALARAPSQKPGDESARQASQPASDPFQQGLTR